MSTAEAISDVINRLYVAAADPGAWPEALATISNLFDGSVVGINHQSFTADGLSWTANHGFDLETLRLHFDVFNTPEKNAGLRALLTAKPLQPFTISSFMSPQEYYRDDSTNVMLISQNIHHGLLNVVDNEGANTSMFLYRGRETGDYRAEDVKVSRLLGVHVRNAVRLAHANFLLNLNESYHAQLPGTRRYGIALVNPRGRLINADAYAQALLASVASTRRGNGSLLNGAQCAVNRIDFQQFLDRAPAFADFLVRDGEDQILQVKMLPAAYVDARFYVATPFKGVALRQIDLDAPQSTPAKQIFGFTPAENAVAELLLQGFSPARISEQLSITSHTVKSHLKSIYAKTGTQRQGEFIARLLRMSD